MKEEKEKERIMEERRNDWERGRRETWKDKEARHNRFINN